MQKSETRIYEDDKRPPPATKKGPRYCAYGSLMI